MSIVLIIKKLWNQLDFNKNIFLYKNFVNQLHQFLEVCGLKDLSLNQKLKVFKSTP